MKIYHWNNWSKNIPKKNSIIIVNDMIHGVCLDNSPDLYVGDGLLISIRTKMKWRDPKSHFTHWSYVNINYKIDI